MRIGRRWVTGLSAALLLLSVPAFAIQRSLAKAGAQGTTKQRGSGAAAVAIRVSPAKAGGRVGSQQRGSKAAAVAIRVSPAKAGGRVGLQQRGSGAAAVAIRVSPAKAGGRVGSQQRGSGVSEVVHHQREEHRTFHEIARDLRAQVRGSGPLERMAVNRFLRDVRAALQQHWRAERRTGVVSPFDFPEF